MAWWLGGGMALGLVVWFGVPWFMPWPDALSRPVSSGFQLTDRGGRPLRRLLADGYRAGEMPAFAELPVHLVEATLAAEDQRFFTHGGVDFLAMGRAARDALRAGRTVGGASTITQQLVKLAVPRKRNLRTKVLEILTARRIEMTWDKERIMEQYLARLDYGNLHRGPQAAAAGYFGKPLGDCSLAECAFLAALPQAPTRLNPWNDPAPALRRQQWILGRLEKLNRGEAQDLARASVEPLRLRRHYGFFSAPHFTDMVLDKLGRNGVPMPSEGTWRTSLDPALQKVCENSVADRLNRLHDRNVTQAAVVVIHNATGEIRAMVGSLDYASAEAGQVNGATAARSPGSALKPFTYLLALQEDLSPASILPDLPVEFMTASGLYRPQNYHHRAAGPVSLRGALAGSLNLSAVRVLDSHGGADALIRCLQGLGMTTLTRSASDYGLGLTIGGGEVSLLELTAAYSTLARMGRNLPISFGTGDMEQGGQQVFDPDACWLLADILSDNDARSRSFGSQSVLRLPFPCAVKTGTSTDYRDNWAVGFNPEFTVGVWAGNFDNSPMRGVSGVTGAAPIFRDIFTWLTTQYPAAWYPMPSSIVTREVDPLTGFPRPEHLTASRPVITEKFRRMLAPTAPDPSRYDAAGRVILPHEYAAWLAGPDNWLGLTTVAAGADPTGNPEWSIASPLPGTTLLLDPDLPRGGRYLPLRTHPARDGFQWNSPTLTIENQAAWLVPGRHELEVTDPGTGRTARTWITVRAL